ncbi:MAG: STAS domain-containing protein [Pseudanabaenaceae cyanobacterium bins.68]|nr:STAS domain-containing protein [Pseudanabaenaceae cyanobacterium bins.68]
MATKFQTIAPQGKLDGISGAKLQQQILELAHGDLDLVLVDLSRVDFLDSAGLGALVTALNALRSINKQLCFCSPGAQVSMILQLTKMMQVFQVFADQAEFEQSLFPTK